MWNSQNSHTGTGLFPSWLRATVGPLLLIAVTLPFSSILLSVSTSYNGSLLSLLDALLTSPLATFRAALLLPTATTLSTLACFVIWQLALMRLVPGTPYEGPPTATGHVPKYVENGPLSFILTLVAYFGVSTWGLGSHLPQELRYSPTILYDEYARLISFLSVAALFVCVALTVKGRTCPSGRDSGSSGSLVIDIYWGTELYPRVLGWDVKQFTNCRFGMMLWGLLPLAFAAHSMGASGEALPNRATVVNVVLQLVYVFKFFLWEKGYMRSIDIHHDRAGYMICWGCMVWYVLCAHSCAPRPHPPHTQHTHFFTPPTQPPPSPPCNQRVPSVYVSHSYFLAVAGDASRAATGAATDISLPTSLALGAFGLLCVYINWAADEQRVQVRETYPNATVWGSKPTVIVAKYKSGKGTRTSILLASGWWGLARHFHYLPEILAAVAWSAPAALVSHNKLVPFFYVAFLTILLLDRAYRDDARCGDKYGKDWVKYKTLVPYRIIPFVF